MSLNRHAPRLLPADVARLVETLARRKPETPLEELEQQNREMMDTLQELRSQQLELKRADERKNQFLATLAHELRNPLGTLHMTLEIMRRHEYMPATQLAERREVMARQTEQLTRLVDDLLDVSRISLGKVELDRRDADVNDLVGQALEMTQAAIQRKGHAVSLPPLGRRLARERRRHAAQAGPVQPDPQRGAVHTGRRRDRHQRAARGSLCGGRRGGQRHRHSGRCAARRVRPVRAGRQFRRAECRPRGRADTGSAPGRGPRR